MKNLLVITAVVLSTLAIGTPGADAQTDAWSCTADYRSGDHVVVNWTLVDQSSVSEWEWQYAIAHDDPNNYVATAHGAWSQFDHYANTLPDSSPEMYWFTSARVDGTSETYECDLLLPQQPQQPILGTLIIDLDRPIIKTPQLTNPPRPHHPSPITFASLPR